KKPYYFFVHLNKIDFTGHSDNRNTNFNQVNILLRFFLDFKVFFVFKEPFTLYIV
ncbi:MAG: hypothetical protein K0S80_3860, partial [Neobacillus sp.]|nr:hypothetical protein [Neobacillus sp.]